MPSGRKPKFSPDQDVEIASAYRAGETTYSIADRYGTSTVPVLHALDRQGVPRRRAGKQSRWLGTDEQVQKALSAYSAGESIEAIANDIGCSERTVSDALRSNGVQLRHGGGSKRRLFDGDRADALLADYADGATMTALAKKYGTNLATIRNTLKRLGVEVRQIGKPAFWTAERHDWLIEQFESGRSQQSIADEVGVSQAVISARLRRLGVLSPIHRSGADHQSWKGGRYVTAEGYVRVAIGPEDQPYVGNGSASYMLEHRLVMARHLNRPLERWEEVHHINAARKDLNEMSNLELRVKPHGAGMRLRCRSCHSIDLEALPLHPEVSDG